MKNMRGAAHRTSVAIGAALILTAISPVEARAHCDTMDGPVVTAARTALETGSLSGVLIWVRHQDEEEVRTAFQQARSVRKLGVEARALADRYFFETVVRVHRSGEGEPYTGLKPTGASASRAVAVADRALASANVAELEKLLVAQVREGLHSRFEHVTRAQQFQPNDILAGRAFVSRYVEFMHYLESVEALGAGARHGNGGHVKP